MDRNDIEPPETRRSFSMAAGATGRNWRAQLYVTLMIWRRVRRPPQKPGAGAPAKRLSAASLPDIDMSPRRPDGPWDDTRRQQRPIRALLLLVVLLLIAWLTADAAVRLLAHVDFSRLASRS